MPMDGKRVTARRLPDVLQGIGWAWRQRARPGGPSRWALAWRALVAAVRHRRAAQHWMAVVAESRARGGSQDLVEDYLRALRPYVHRTTGISTRVVQLVDHFDWQDGAFKSSALELMAAGKPLVLADLPPPRGFVSLRLQLVPTPPASPEGELLLTLTLLPHPDARHKGKPARPVDVAALAFSVFRVAGEPCLVIGGIRGQRDGGPRVSSSELVSALSGWKPPVLMVRVAQELARHWGLLLVGLDPGWHRLHGWRSRWSRRQREAAARLDASYDGLWAHFNATKGPPGWMVLPLHSDEQLAATDLSAQRRQRQSERADYWIRIRALLRLQFREQLVKPVREAQVSRITQAMPLEAGPQDYFADRDDEVVPSRMLSTGPGALS